MKAIIAVINKVGTVVHIMALTCSNNSLPDTAGARFVVSDNGEILSPKYAPDITKPAVIGRGRPRPALMPMSATPTVELVVQQHPVARATTTLIIKVAK